MPTIKPANMMLPVKIINRPLKAKTKPSAKKAGTTWEIPLSEPEG